MSTGACPICSELRDNVLTVFGEELDPDTIDAVAQWHADQHPATSPFAMPTTWSDGRGPGTADAIDLAEFEVGSREVVCSECHLVHRPEVEC